MNSLSELAEHIPPLPPPLLRFPSYGLVHPIVDLIPIGNINPIMDIIPKVDIIPIVGIMQNSDSKNRYQHNISKQDSNTSYQNKLLKHRYGSWCGVTAVDAHCRLSLRGLSAISNLSMFSDDILERRVLFLMQYFDDILATLLSRFLARS